MSRKRLYTVVGCAASVVFLYFSLSGVDYRRLWETLAGARYGLLPLPFLFIVISVVLCAYRWSRIAGERAGFRDTFVALLIGLFVNNVLPARIGEVARGYVLAKRARMSFTFALSTVLIDRVFDLAALLLMALVFLPKWALPAAVSRGIIAVVVILAIGMAILFTMGRERFMRVLTDRLSGSRRPLFRKVSQRLALIQENLKRINSPLSFLYLLLISFLIWFSMSVALYLVAVMVGVKVVFAAVPFVCALLNVGLTLPSSPGYVGVYQFLIVYLLAIFGVPKAEGFAVSILYHALWFVPYNVLGFTASLKEHLRMTDLKDLDKRAL